MTDRPLHWSEKAKQSAQPGATDAPGAPGASGVPGAPGVAGGAPAEAPGASPADSPGGGGGARPPVWVPPRHQAGAGMRALLWIVPLVLICAAAVVAAILLWPEGTAEVAAVSGSTTQTTLATTSTEPAPPLAATYQSPNFDCSFSYPDWWVEYAPEAALGMTITDPTAILLGDPGSVDAAGAPTDFLMFIARRWPGQPAPSARSVVDAMIKDFSADHPDSETLYQPATDYQVNAMQACSWAKSGQSGGGVWVTRIVVVSSGDGSYIFESRSPENALTSSWAVLDAIVQSFRVGS